MNVQWYCGIQIMPRRLLFYRTPNSVDLSMLRQDSLYMCMCAPANQLNTTVLLVSVQQKWDTLYYIVVIRKRNLPFKIRSPWKNILYRITVESLDCLFQILLQKSSFSVTENTILNILYSHFTQKQTNLPLYTLCQIQYIVCEGFTYPLPCATNGWKRHTHEFTEGYGEGLFARQRSKHEDKHNALNPRNKLSDIDCWQMFHIRFFSTKPLSVTRWFFYDCSM